jgi:hypothetical protein
MDEEFGRRDPRQVRDGRRSTRGPEALDQRLERWVSRGRDLVDGVSGSRPGQRQAAGDRPGLAGLNPGRLGRWVEDRMDWLFDDGGDDDWREPWQEAGARPSRPAPGGGAERGTGGAGLERDPGGAGAARGAGRAGEERAGAPRRSLEAISRRPAPGPAPLGQGGNRSTGGSSPIGGSSPTAATPPFGASAPSGAPAEDPDGAWPDDTSFSLPRWQRPAAPRSTGPAGPVSPPPPDGGGRALPRSTRRR